MKTFFVFLFILFFGYVHSQRCDSLNDPAIFLKKIETNIHFYQVYENEWFYIKEKSKWHYKENKIHFRIPLYYSGESDTSQVFHLLINGSYGETIGSYLFSIDSNLSIIDSIVMPIGMLPGHYTITGFVNSRTKKKKVFNDQFIMNSQTDVFYLFSRENIHEGKYDLKFFLGPTTCNGQDCYVLACKIQSKDKISSKIKGYVLMNNFLTASTFEIANDGIGVISKVLENFDSMIIRIAWPEGPEFDYHIPAVEEKPLLFETSLVDNALKYELWFPQFYSANAGWILMVGIFGGKIIFSHVANTTGELFMFKDEFLFNNMPSGIVKLIVFKKGGEKISERSLYYPGKDSK